MLLLQNALKKQEVYY